MRYGILPVERHCLFCSVKSPPGDGRDSRDYNRAEGPEDLQKAMADMK